MEETSTGQWLAAMVDEYMEPSSRFLSTLHVLFVSRSSQRALFGRVEIDGACVTDAGGFAAQALRGFVEVGILDASDGGFSLQGGELDPLLVGLMMMRPGGTQEKKSVGDIGEGLTLRWLKANGWEAIRVSEVADEFGFDLLATKNSKGKAIECKASAAQSGPFRGFLTRHELTVASKLKEQYELLVWGQVNIAESLDQNYVRLTAAGFPRVIVSPWEWLKQHAPMFVDGHRTSFGHEVRPDGVILGVP